MDTIRSGTRQGTRRTIFATLPWTLRGILVALYEPWRFA